MLPCLSEARFPHQLNGNGILSLLGVGVGTKDTMGVKVFCKQERGTPVGLPGFFLFLTAALV